MRKFYLRWWFTSNWQQDRHDEMMRHWHAAQTEPVNDAGVSLRYVRERSNEDERYFVRYHFVNLETGELTKY